MTSRLGIYAAVAALVLTAITSLGSAASAAADPMIGAPAVGQCFDVNRAELQPTTYTEAAVDCSAPHTSVVLAVATLPSGMSYDGGDARRWRLLGETCLRDARHALGTSTVGFGLTAYNFGFFLPTGEQQAAGARWLRCDLVLRDGDRPLPLPDNLEVGSFPFSRQVSRCLAGHDLHVTACAERHTYRSTWAAEIRGAHYPSRTSWLATGRSLCSRGVSTPRDYRFTWATKAMWQTGDHTLVCYSRSRR
jgi:hypothetical protein